MARITPTIIDIGTYDIHDNSNTRTNMYPNILIMSIITIDIMIGNQKFIFDIVVICYIAKSFFQSSIIILASPVAQPARVWYHIGMAKFLDLHNIIIII